MSRGRPGKTKLEINYLILHLVCGDAIEYRQQTLSKFKRWAAYSNDNPVVSFSGCEILPGEMFKICAIVREESLLLADSKTQLQGITATPIPRF